MEQKTLSSKLFDGPFKVPLPRKITKSQTVVTQAPKIKVPKPVYKPVSVESQYEWLLRLIQNPESITKYDIKVLSSHPVINNLLKECKKKTNSNSVFYIPIESLLRPFCSPEFSNLQENTDGMVNTSDVDMKDAQEDELSYESTSSSHDSNEAKIGIYTTKERQEKIKKYKEKVNRWKNGFSNQKTNRRQTKLKNKQPRVKGRFSKYVNEEEDFTKLYSHDSEKHSELESSFAACSQEFRNSRQSDSLSKDLNQIVAELTGIF